MKNTDPVHDIKNLINLGPWKKNKEGSYLSPDKARETCWRELMTMRAVLEDAMATGEMPDTSVALARLVIEDLVQALRGIEFFHCWMAGIGLVSEAANRPDDEKVIESPQQRLTETEQASEIAWAAINFKLDEVAPTRPALDKETFTSGFLQGAGWAHKRIADTVERMDAERALKGGA